MHSRVELALGEFGEGYAYSFPKTRCVLMCGLLTLQPLLPPASTVFPSERLNVCGGGGRPASGGRGELRPPGFPAPRGAFDPS
jgi:hypothetical protein